jgi:hypothetical protein
MAMKYGVQGKVKAIIGDVLNFTYKNYQEDKHPSVCYLTSMRNEKGEVLVSGFNLNFLKKLKDQQELIAIVRRHINPKNAYNSVVSNSKFSQLYRVYSEKYMVGVMKYDLARKILIPLSKPDTSNKKDPRNKKT